MTFEEWWEDQIFDLPWDHEDSAHCAWDAAKPQPLTDDEIRECWRACGGSAPMAFAREIQKKLGITTDAQSPTPSD